MLGLETIQLACPHGSKLPCSQCQPGISVQKITRDEQTGMLMLDGIPVRTSSNIGPSFVPPNAGKEATGRRPATCTRCGQIGHMRNKCP